MITARDGQLDWMARHGVLWSFLIALVGLLIIRRGIDGKVILLMVLFFAGAAWLVAIRLVL